MSALADLGGQLRRSGIGRWFYGRERSEQQIILALGALVAVLCLWAFVWKPVADWSTVEANRHNNAQQLYDWLQSNEQAARDAAKNSNNNRAGGARITTINKSAKAHDLLVNRLQPESNGIVSVILQAQSFNQIISWVNQLEENNGVLVDRANFDEQDAPGYVNAQIRLK
ncbi:MAG: type II secretion system protein M [Pseudomonadota bacterium]